MILRKMLSIVCVLLLFVGICFTAQAQTVTDGDISYTYQVTGENTASLQAVSGITPRMGLEIPRELEGYTITSIGYGILREALSSGEDLAMITIPNTVTQIDPGFLAGVRLFNMNAGKDQALVQLEEGNSVYSYVFQAETGCLLESETGRVIAVPEHRNKTLTIAPGAKILGAAALEGISVHTLYLPASLEKIEEGALDGLEGVDYFDVDAENTCFVIKGKKLLDAEGNTLYPTEAMINAMTEPTLAPEVIERQEKEERINTIMDILGYALIAVAILPIILVIVHTIRGYGAMQLSQMFKKPLVSFFDIMFCAVVLLLPSFLEEEPLISADNLVVTAITVLGILGGIIGIILEFYMAGGFFWAVERLIAKAIFLVAACAISISEGFFAGVIYMVVLWRVVANAVFGAATVIYGLGLAPLFGFMGDLADIVVESFPTILLPTDEVEDLGYEGYYEQEKVFLSSKGELVKAKGNRYSNTMEVTDSRGTRTAKKLTGGGLLIENDKEEKTISRRRPAEMMSGGPSVKVFLVGALILIPNILLMIQFLTVAFA